MIYDYLLIFDIMRRSVKNSLTSQVNQPKMQQLKDLAASGVGSTRSSSVGL